MNSLTDPTKALHARAAATAKLLRALANTSRLLILCRLYRHGESGAGELAAELGLGMSALSQHLARMREEGLVSQRRQSRQIFYKLNATSSAQLPALLASICGDDPDVPGDARTDTPNATTLSSVLDLAFAGDGVRATNGFWLAPAIPAAGKIHPLPQAAYQPAVGSASVKVVFGLTTAASRTDQIHPGLQRVARLVNLYAHAQVPLDRLHFVAVASGAAATMTLDDVQYQRQYGRANPNLPVIGQLRNAGIDVAVCGQSLAEQGYPFDGIGAGVILALSALTAIGELQQKGYALMPL